MRKHFLILMLMALLPMVGFAATLDPAKFSATNITYGTSVLPTVTPSGYTEGSDYTLETTQFYRDDQGSEAIDVAKLATTAVGKYYIKVNGANAYAGLTVYVDFWINVHAITDLDVDAFGAEEYTGSQIKPATTGKVTASSTTLLENTDYTVAYGENVNVGTGSVTITGKGNCSGSVTTNFAITAKPFLPANIAFTVTDNEVTYDGTADQKAKIVVTDKVLGSTLEEGKDYTVTYESGHQNVGSYAITLTGKGNYTTDDIDTEKKLIIGPATLLVTPKATKVYDGTTNLPVVERDAFTFEGFVDTKTKDDVSVNTTTWESDANLTKNVKDGYLLKVKNNAFTISDNNYIFAPVDGTLDITAHPLEIYAGDQTIGYGSSVATDVFTVNTPSSPDVTDFAANDLPAIKRAVISYADGTTLKVKANTEAAEDDKVVLANYDVSYNTNSKVEETGTLTITKASITIALNSNVKLEKVYDGTPATIIEDVTNRDYLRIIGNLIGTDVLDLSGLTATVADNTGAVNTAPGYKVTLSGATVSANADKYTINYVTTYYKVAKKDLQITIKDQSVNVGDDAATAIDKTLFTVEGLVSADGSKDDIFELSVAEAAKDGDVIDDIASGEYINLNVKSGKETVAANYSYTTTKGKLVIVAAGAIILDDATDLSSVLKAKNGVDVTFSSRKLTKNVWTTMVLPFEATVRQISSELGYAVVDMFVEDANSEDMNFKLYMGNIPAYTPFLVKTDEDINMNTVKFIGVDIVAPIVENLTRVNKSYNFIGKMDLEAIASDFWAVGSKMTEDDFQFNKYASGKKVAPMRAYITAKTGVTAAPRIIIEEPDGSFTAINGITNEAVKMEKDGWYTINGMKLQGVPAQKGIYIRNGKKFVVK